MITNRFYITTIISIFLSLSMGILIGGTLGQQWIQENQEKVVSYFQSEANQLREKNKEYEHNVELLEAELETKKEEIQLLFDKSVDHLIEGKKVLWIGNQSDKGFSQLKNSITVAGSISDQLEHDTTVFHSITKSEKSNENPSNYDLIIYVPTSEEELIATSSQFPSSTPTVIISNTELKKPFQNPKVFLRKVDASSINEHYDFLLFLKTVFEEYKG